MTQQTLTLLKPDDFHVHLRDGSMLRLVAGHSARNFGRILVMPNLSPPIETVEQALNYRKRILRAIAIEKGRRDKFYKSHDLSCLPLMTLYLTQNTTKLRVREVITTEAVIGFKLYPAHATTQSQFGVRDIDKIFPIFEEMEKRGVYLMVHGEDISVDIFDREKVFIEKTLSRIIKTFPALKITLEHITTRDAVDFIKKASPQVRASVTPHHLLLDRNDLLAGGINPHHYCMPIVKRNIHRDYLLKTVLSGNEKFFLGSDSAPHWEKNKLTACGCAGIYSSPIIMPLLAQLFEQNGSLSLLENFTSVFGARHYELEPNRGTLTLVKKVMQVPLYYRLPKTRISTRSPQPKLIPLKQGETLSWQVKK